MHHKNNEPILDFTLSGLGGIQNWNETGTYCSRADEGGQHEGGLLISDGRFLRVRFFTDLSVRRAGFSLILGTS